MKFGRDRCGCRKLKLRAGRLGLKHEGAGFRMAGSRGLVAGVDVDRLNQGGSIEVAIERRRTNSVFAFVDRHFRGRVSALSAEATAWRDPTALV